MAVAKTKAAAKSKAPAKKTAKPTPAKSAAATRLVGKKAVAEKAVAEKAASPKAASPKAAAKKVAKTSPSSEGAPKRHRIFGMSFASIYPLYVQKVERKGRTATEVDEVVAWLTGYRGETLRRAIDTKIDLERFFAEAPRMNPNAGLIRGVVCGVRVEEVADPLMQKIRYLDKLVDEIAQGKKMASILRA